MAVLVFKTIWFFRYKGIGIRIADPTKRPTESAVDLASLMMLVLMLAAEVIATMLGMWLLFRTTQVYNAQGEGFA